VQNISIKVLESVFTGDYRNAIHSNSGTLGRLSLYVSNCHLDGLSSTTENKSKAAIWLNSCCDSVVIKNSIFKIFSFFSSVKAICIIPDKKDCNYVEIKDNEISNIHSSENQEIQGIMVFLKKAVIKNNTIRNISSVSVSTSDCEGIYTKVANCSIVKIS